MSKTISLARLGWLMGIWIALGVVSATAQSRDTELSADATSPWPHRVLTGAESLWIYPPEIESWEGGRAEGRAAVTLLKEDQDPPVFGLAWLSARGEAAESERLLLRDFEVIRVEFPTVPQRTQDLFEVLRSGIRELKWLTTLSRIEEEVAIAQARERGREVPLRHDAPRILISERPAVLVPIDGAPVLRPVKDAQWQRVVNTRALILLDVATGRYYLRLLGRWMSAASPEGAWSLAYIWPSELDRIKDEVVAGQEFDLLEAEADEDNVTLDSEVPAVFASTVSAELVQLDGAPDWRPIPQTRLLYAVNAEDTLLLDTHTQNYYLLLSGRWYRARALEQTGWEYVAGMDLPADIARIPSRHELAHARAFVPNTTEAKAAAISASVPQMAKVRRTSTTLEVDFDGAPRFEPIEGTSLEYAVNAPIPVIRAGAWAYYALDNGVWFRARAPEGPWKVADFVPAEIYSIPPSSALHYVTYVRVYDASDEDVYVHYTPGYLGSYVTREYTVVYGTGWRYRPWIGRHWHARPATWGFHFHPKGSLHRIHRSRHGFTPWWRPLHHSKRTAGSSIRRQPIAGVPVAGPPLFVPQQTQAPMRTPHNVHRRWSKPSRLTDPSADPAAPEIGGQDASAKPRVPQGEKVIRPMVPDPMMHKGKQAEQGVGFSHRRERPGVQPQSAPAPVAMPSPSATANSQSGLPQGGPARKTWRQEAPAGKVWRQEAPAGKMSVIVPRVPSQGAGKLQPEATGSSQARVQPSPAPAQTSALPAPAQTPASPGPQRPHRDEARDKFRARMPAPANKEVPQAVSPHPKFQRSPDKGASEGFRPLR